MGAMNEYAGQNQRVGHLERERAEQYLSEAYAQGRIDEDEFERRIDRTLNARTRGDLNAAFADLVPVTAQYFGPHPAYRPTPPRDSVELPGAKGAAGIAHLLPFVSWIIGPAFVYAVSSPGSYARREAAKSFNWTLFSSALFFALGMLGIWFVPDVLLALAWFAWVALTVIGAVKAFAGENWTNPLLRVIPWKPLTEK
ncbi:DUF1707 and DUF4870 domain-containing protein [Naumannella cuiyingiana]|uniref:DUF1707 domain-containing protein n=1 Tax=Naumannella cuiyingiana TaxID=1347891 RepID=A0A7Z0D6L9_9ACTN|nr:DUF1707 and DUF4870 domain-containing protein [Naumannella cuiyingiana]NYI69857.1 hypothetical protein [Naumannella cuiyingiana]